MTDTFVNRLILSDSTLRKVVTGVEFVGRRQLNVRASCEVLQYFGPY